MTDDSQQACAEQIPIERLVHRLNSPLGALDLMAADLAGECDENQRRETAGRISREVWRVAGLLKKVSFCESGRRSRVCSVQVPAVVSQAVASATSCSTGLPQPVVCRPIRACSVLGDATLLAGMIEELVSNAMESATSKVEIHVDVDEIHALIQVQDDGPGLSAECLAAAWRAFYSSKPGHSGLGLNVAAKVARLHGAEIALGNRHPTGVRAWVRVPIEQER
jgi:signal transduction histidine kinase